MSKTKKSMQPPGKKTKQSPPKTASNYGSSPLVGEVGTIDFAVSTLNNSDKTLTRLIERIKSL